MPGGGSTSTNGGGSYAFTAVEEGDWQIEPVLNGDFRGCIDTTDAMLVLEAAVGARTLTPEQQIAADVSGNGSITSHDASLILQYAQSLIASFPVSDACNSPWVFQPEAAAMPNQTLIEPQISPPTCSAGAIELHPLDASVTSRNFRGILLGDVSRTWILSGGCPQ
jgi:hypothetical protein